MPATSLLYISEPRNSAVSTGVDSNAPVTKEYGREDNRKQSWDAIEAQLISWGCDPHQLDEGGTVTPSGDTIRQAIQFATDFARQSRPAPTRVVPDVRGGIVFELAGPNRLETIHVHADSRIEYRLIVNHRVVNREFWN